MADKGILVRDPEGFPANATGADVAVAPRFKATGVGGVAFDAGGGRVIGLPLIPTDATDAASKDYVDQKLLGFHAKKPARVATTANISNLDAPPSVIDGVTLAVGDRVLVKNQTDQKQNGIYVYEDGQLVRAPDADDDGELQDGNTIWIGEGGQAGTLWQLTTNNPIIIGTTPIEWEQFSGVADIVPGTGIEKVGNTISAKIGTTAGTVAAGNHSHTVIAGNGLTGGGSLPNGGSVSLAVGAGNGITVGASAISARANTDAGISVDASGIGVSISRGLTFYNGDLGVDPGDGLTFETSGNKIQVAAGNGLGFASSGALEVKTWGALAFDPSGNLLLDVDEESLTLDNPLGKLAAQGVIAHIEIQSAINPGDVIAVDPNGFGVKASATGNARVIGIALGGGNSGRIRVLVQGAIPNPFATGAPGDVIFLGTTAGSVSTSPPASGRQIRLGFVGDQFFYLNVTDWGMK